MCFVDVLFFSNDILKLSKIFNSTAISFLTKILIVHLLGMRPCAPGDAEMPTQQVSALREFSTEQGMGALGVRLQEAAEKDSRRA